MNSPARSLVRASPRPPSPLTRLSALWKTPAPSETRALSYGFLAIGAFFIGGVGYLGGLFGARGLALHLAAAIVSFALASRHTEAA